jgi:hypothetical protein
MAQFFPGDEVADLGKSFTYTDPVTFVETTVNFVTQGYMLGDPIDDPAKYAIDIYGSFDINFNSFVTVKVQGVDTVLDGTAHPNVDDADATLANYIFSAPDAPGILYMKWVGHKTDEVWQQTKFFNHVIGIQ